MLVPQLAEIAPLRWPWFTPAALHTGAQAVFVFPLCPGRIRLGALSLYRSATGPLSAHELHDTRLLAEAAETVLISGRGESDPLAEPGAWAVADSSGFQARLYQAVGVVTEQLRIDADDALARIRAFAYTADRPIRQVTEAIVTGHLRLDAA